ncbi:hypothetical protein NMG60_11022380 [Bertholletia excelsa]
MSSLSRLLRRSFATAVSSPPQPHPKSIKSLSTDLYKERSLERLVDKFKNFSESYRFRTKSGIYESTVRRLAAAQHFSSIEEILEEQKKYKDISDEGFTVRLITLYGKSGMFDHASKVFDEMPQYKCDRTVKSLNALLGACLNSKKFDKIDGYFRDLPKKLGVKPDVVSYNTLIKAFCEMGSLDSALSMVDEMLKNGLRADLITYNTLLDGLYRKGRFLDGEKMWSRMERMNVVPDIRSYNAKLIGLVSEKRMAEAAELARGLKDKGLKADIFTYNTVIEGYCKDGSLEEAKKWYRNLKSNANCSPNKATFRMLIPLACEKGDIDWAFKLCKDIFNKRCLFDEADLQLVVDGLVKQSKVEQAQQLVKLASTNCYCRRKLNLPSNKN